jgi:hypothetical protein
MPLPDDPLPDDDARAAAPADETDSRGLPVGADLAIKAAGEHCYDVTIGHPSGASTRHVVDVPETLLSDLGASAAQEPLLVRASLVYLLQHDPSSLPEQFDLAEIGAAIPGYREDIVSRL